METNFTTDEKNFILDCIAFATGLDLCTEFQDRFGAVNVDVDTVTEKLEI